MKYEQAFPILLDMVERGWVISKALKKLGLNRSIFYQKCPRKLLSELQHTKATHLVKPAHKGPRLNEFFVLYSLPNEAIVKPFGEVAYEV